MGETQDRGLPISAVSERLGIPVPTIRSWERRYDYPAPARTQGKHRRYTEQEVEQLRALRDEIARRGSVRKAIDHLRSRPPDLPEGAGFRRSIIEGATRMDSLLVRRALEDATLALGVEGAVVDVLFPSFEEIGRMWQEREVDVACEHLATQAARLWLGRTISMAPAAFRKGTVVFACGPDDQHSMGLETFEMLLARRGWRGHMLGSSTPAMSLVHAIAVSEASAVVVTAHQSTTRRGAVESLRLVSGLPSVQAFFGGGAFITPAARRGVPGTYLGEDLLEAVELFDRAMSDEAVAANP